MLILNRFELLEQVGEGATAIVYRARDRETRRDVAVKVLRPPTADRAESGRESFDREATRLKRVPRGVSGVPRLVEQAPGLLVMEYVGGAPVAQTWPFAWGFPFAELALLVVRRVADMLATLHEAGIVHGDVTERNVLLSPSGPGLVDFGASSNDPAGDVAGLLLNVTHWMLAQEACRWPVPVDAFNATCPRSVARLLVAGVSDTAAGLRDRLDAILADVGLSDPEAELAALLRDPVEYRREFPTRAVAALEASPDARRRRGGFEVLAAYARPTETDDFRSFQARPATS